MVPDFDHATPAPTPVATAPAIPQPASAPANAGGADDDFIARIERTLAESDGASQPALSPGAQPIQLAPPATVPAYPVPPADIPMTDAQGQPLQLPQEFLLLDTE